MTAGGHVTPPGPEEKTAASRLAKQPVMEVNLWVCADSDRCEARRWRDDAVGLVYRTTSSRSEMLSLSSVCAARLQVPVRLRRPVPRRPAGSLQREEQEDVPDGEGNACCADLGGSASCSGLLSAQRSRQKHHKLPGAKPALSQSQRFHFSFKIISVFWTFFTVIHLFFFTYVRLKHIQLEHVHPKLFFCFIYLC